MLIGQNWGHFFLIFLSPRAILISSCLAERSFRWFLHFAVPRKQRLLSGSMEFDWLSQIARAKNTWKSSAIFQAVESFTVQIALVDARGNLGTLWKNAWKLILNSTRSYAITYYSTHCDTALIWSFSTQYTSPARNRYPAIYVVFVDWGSRKIAEHFQK